MFENTTEQQAKDQILEMVDTYCQKYHNQQKPFQEGEPHSLRIQSLTTPSRNDQPGRQRPGILAYRRQICRSV